MLRQSLVVVLALLAVATVPGAVHAGAAALQANGSDPLGPVVNLTAFAAGIASTFILGGVKKYTGLADTAAWKVVKPVQPLVVGAISLLAYPLIARATGVTDLPPAEIVAQAPTASLVGVLARELFRKVVGQPLPVYRD